MIFGPKSLIEERGQNKSLNLIDLVQRRNRNNSLKTSFTEWVAATEELRVVTKRKKIGPTQHHPRKGPMDKRRRRKARSETSQNTT
uniref:Uncharacterized protein n=1 Tax=Lactuca sativa TaxID=4236 RepID=A0A9R1WNQ2_LACSA|nr:hypothetical protein LSAT_V11C900463840 [Lactuca sativa]